MRTLVKSVLFSTILVLGLVCVASAQLYFPTVPRLMTVQGKLTDAAGDALADGTYGVAFTIWDASVDGDAIWGDTMDVETTDGLFSIMLGSDNSLPYDAFNNQSRYLGMKVGGDPEMTPRQRLTTVPYAMMAHDVDGPIIDGFNIIDGSITDDDVDASAAIDISKIFGSAGVDYNTDLISQEVTITVTELASVTIACPKAGRVILCLSGEMTIHGNHTLVEVGFGTAGSPFAYSHTLGRHDPSGSEYYKLSFCPVYVLSVAAGSWTYTANAQVDNIFNNYPVYADQVSFIALYVPNQY